MSPPRKRRSSKIVAKDGHAAPGKCGGELDKEKNWYPSGLGRRKGTSGFAVSCGRQFLDHVPIQNGNLKQMLRDLIERRRLSRTLHPKLARLWWTSTYEPEERSDLSVDTKSGRNRFPFEEKFKILGCAMNRQGKTNDALEERMQSGLMERC